MSISTVEVSSTLLAHDYQSPHRRPRAWGLRNNLLVKGDSISQSSTTKAGQVLSRVELFRYWLYTIWLFTENDIATFLVQCFLFGLSGAASGSLTTAAGGKPFGFFDAVSNLPRLVLFNWLNLLIFNLGNQSMPGAPEEDALNKPQRPIPAGRITQREAQTLLMGVILVTLPVMFALDVHLETSLLIVFEYMYNELGGGDVHYHVRNALLSIGFALYNAGSLKLAASPLGRVSGAGYHAARSWGRGSTLLHVTRRHFLGPLLPGLLALRGCRLRRQCWDRRGGGWQAVPVSNTEGGRIDVENVVSLPGCRLHHALAVVHLTD